MGNTLVLILRIVSFVFLARALLSWIPIGHDSPFRPVADLLFRVTEPVLAPIRSVLPPMGGFDLSVFIVILVINFGLIELVKALT